MLEYVNTEQIKFLLHEVHDVQDVLKLRRFQDFDSEAINILVDSAEDFADKELHPYFQEIDQFGVKYDNGEIIVHPRVGEMMKKSGENGFICSAFDYEDGGVQTPHMALTAVSIIFSSADNTIMSYTGLTAGAASLIQSFGDREQFDAFVPNMMAGKWQGTMCLTEPQAGSSLSDIKTAAYLQKDGTYKIEGQKIFITAGEHNQVDNIVHLLLARIEGAPLGTKGISLFIVPKHRINDDGSLEYNDVFCAGDFIKMGQRGASTTHLVFGEDKNCTGYLVGDANNGLKYMFQMMNGARLDVGVTAMSIANAAYHKSLQYAKERPQGRKLANGDTKNPNREQVAIIEHPDVRRMLLLQRAIVDGSLSLAFATAKYMDISYHSPDKEEREVAHNLLEILTPIVKTYPSEMGRISVSNGLQVFGGYGFTCDFPLEQYHRDIRITALYEGTTGIQSMDLLGRKVTMNNGAAMFALAAEVKKAIAAAQTYDDLKPYAKILDDKLNLMQTVLGKLMGFAMSGNYERFLSDATIFMDFMSTIVIGWQWINMATSAKEAMVTSKMTYSEDFYKNQVHTMKFFYKYEMPKTLGLAETLMSDEVLTIKMKEEKVFA
ncbi:MAG: acyl-CoA dehydrogenase [Saprospiraceae bacterium]